MRRGERAQTGEERSRQRDAVWCLVGGRLETDRDGERPTLRLGELLRHFGQGTVEQVGETAERERHLRFRAPRHENPHAGLLRQLDAGTPEHGLPDSRLAANERGACTTVQVVDRPRKLSELVLPPDELEVGGNGHAVIVVLPANLSKGGRDRSVGVSETRANATSGSVRPDRAGPL